MRIKPDKPAFLIFLAALILRWSYALTLFLTMGEDGIRGADSARYLRNVAEFAAAITSGGVHGWDWLGPDPWMMPLQNWMMALCALIAGAAYPLVYVLLQGLLDSFTCIFIYAIAATIDRRFAAPAGLAAAINPTLFVMSGLIYPDTPFTFFVAMMLYGAIVLLRQNDWWSASWLAIGVAGAALVRILIVPWAACLVVFLAVATLLARGFDKSRLIKISMLALAASLATGLIVARNYSKYGAIGLTPQSGTHFALWIVPLAQEAKDGTPWAKTYDAIEERARARFGTLSQNPFEQSRQYTIVGREALQEIGWFPTAKSWMIGAVTNLASPGAILSPPIIQIPRTGFYATPGADRIEKVLNFIFKSESAVYVWTLLIGIAGVLVLRLLQLAGIAILFARGEVAMLLLFSAWIGYVLIVNGPVASPKYRLPLEPVLMVLTGIGAATLIRRFGANPHSRHS